MKNIQAVILAAGEGTRLRPLTKNRPKVMLPLVNIPLLGHVLDTVVSCGIRDITVVVGYKKEQVMTFLNTYPVSVNIVVQPKQLGTADALSYAKKFIHTRTLVISGDNYIDPESIRKMMVQENAILVAPHKKPENFGVVLQEDGILTDIVEKPEHIRCSAMVSCGIYTFAAKQLQSVIVPTIPELLKQMLASGQRITAVLADDWRDAIYPWDLLHLNDHILKQTAQQIAGAVDQHVIFRGKVSIGENTTIGPGTVIEGPVVIGGGCSIGAHVCIGPNTTLGERVTIEPLTYISQSIVMNDCSIGSHSRIVESVIGEGCSISDHFATLTSDGHQYGVIIGDRAKIGPFTIFTSTVIGNRAEISGNKRIDAMIPDNSLVM